MMSKKSCCIVTLLFSLSFMDIGAFASEAEQPVRSILKKDYNTDKSGYNIHNTRYFEFATIDGGKVSNHVQNGRGKIDTTYTGMSKNQYGWWHVKAGKVDTNYIVTFEGR